MRTAEAAVTTVGVIHLGIAASEVFLWKKPAIALDLKAKLGLDQDATNKVSPIVANTGLYNAFIGMGLIWSVAKGNDPFKLFFLACGRVSNAERSTVQARDRERPSG
jgi:uncharacterized membrane protein